MAAVDKHLEEIITCSICQETFQRPRQLPCQHVYCTHCLEALLSKETTNDKASLDCPLCRVTHLIPSDGVDGFPIAFIMLDLCDVFQRQQEDSVTSHREIHRGILMQLQEYNREYVSSCKLLQQVKADFVTKCDLVEDVVKRHADNLHKSIDLEMNAVLKEVKLTKSDILGQIRTEEERLQDESEKVQYSTEFYQNNTNNSPDMRNFAQLSVTLNTDVNVIVPNMDFVPHTDVARLGKLRLHSEDYLCRNPVQSGQNEESETRVLQTCYNEERDNPHPLAVHLPPVETLKKSQSCIDNERCNTQVRNTLPSPASQVVLVSLSSQSFTVEKASEFKIPFLPKRMSLRHDGQLLLYGNGCVGLWGAADGTKNPEITSGVDQQCQACFRNSELLITDTQHNCVRILTNRGRVYCYMDKIKIGGIRQPQGICISSKGLYISSSTENKLYELELSENDGLLTSETFSSSDQPFRIGSNTYLSCGADMVVVSCPQFNKVYIYGMDHSLRAVFDGRRDSPSGRVKQVTGNCVDPHGNILVADSKNHEIFVLSSSGRLLGELNTSAGIKFPYSLCFYGNQLVVGHGPGGMGTVTSFHYSAG